MYTQESDRYGKAAATERALGDCYTAAAAAAI